MASEKVRKLSLAKRVAGLLFIGAVGIVSFAGTSWFFHHIAGAPKTNDLSEAPNIFTHVFVMFFLGCLSLCAGVFCYAVVLLTQCFTFDFRKPFWNTFKVKLYVAHIIVILFVIMGFACFASMVLTPILTKIGLPTTISFLVPILGMLVIVQFLFMWINIWAPLEKAVVKSRLTACGISKEDMERGMYTGISDPAKSSFKKLTMVEEDIGMLWIEADELIYRGDSDGFRIHRRQLIEVERVTDSGSMSAYAGNVHIILRFRTEDGTERRTRLHTLVCWTLGRLAKASNSLAKRLVSWQGAES